jgi:hypothetical protein
MFIIPAALILALAAGYSALWLYAAHRLEDGFVAWAGVQASRGHAIEHGKLALSGFPGPIKLAIDAPRYASAKTGWQWSAERATLEMRPWDWWTYRLDIFGRQTLALPFDGVPPELTGQAATAFVIAEVDGRGRVKQSALTVDGLELGDAAGKLLSVATIRATGRVQGTGAVPHEETAIDLWLQTKSVTLGPPVQSPLGPRLDEVGLSASVKGALPDTLQRASVDGWRQDGGTVELTHFHIAWGALEISATGTVALDEMLRPLGAVSAEIKGYGETLTALEAAQVVPPKAAAGSRLALDLLSRPDGADGRRVVTIPVSAQNGALYLGPIRLVRLEPIPFPAR